MIISQETKRQIGILGGMGPEATVHMMARVVAMTAAEDDSDHVPMMVDNNTQIPSRIKALIEKTGDDPGPVLADMARGLESSGAKALAMPCNTAHHYAAIIEKAVGIPLLNMVTLSSSRLHALEQPVKRVGILASPVVQTTQIFDHAFEPHGIKTVYPVNQNRMLDAIRALKIDSGDAIAQKIIEKASLELVENRADCLLIACSEISIIADTIPSSILCLDTVDILAEAIIEFAGATLRKLNPGGAAARLKSV